MTVSDLTHLLPEKPPQGLREWAHTFDEHMGGNLLLFHREPVEESELWPDRQGKPNQKRWGARCYCTACGEDYVTGWCSYPKAGVKGIRIHMGEDGFWPGYVDDEDTESIEVAEGENVLCPWCDRTVQLVHTSSVRRGRTWQMMLGNVTVCEGYTVVMTWLYRRRLADGVFYEDIRPARAVAITKRGGLRRFDHVRGNSYCGTYDLPAWVEVASAPDDPFLMLYYNYDACNHKQVGGEMWKTMPANVGTTGEKTGLSAYVENGGRWPVAYLKLWKRWPYVENLMKSGFGHKLVQDINGQIAAQLDYGNRSGRVHIEWADLSERSPSQMLGMTKPELTLLSNKWTIIKLEEWQCYRHYSARMTATQFDQCLQQIGLEAMQTINSYGEELADEEWVEKAVRYVAKQKGMPARAAAELLCDLWDMLEEESNGRIITEEELWPRDLRVAHDRLAEDRELQKNAEENAKLSAGFRAIVDKYGVLEWTDGELCVRLPRKNSELKMEGATLRHCVGGYGKGHIAERTVVFFVRHYRRPERSYYTMDYNMTGEPRRNQLHGYGNEHHGENKQYRHSIPKKVMDFIERWEREVLRPWYAKRIPRDKQYEKKKQKRSA